MFLIVNFFTIIILNKSRKTSLNDRINEDWNPRFGCGDPRRNNNGR